MGWERTELGEGYRISLSDDEFPKCWREGRPIWVRNAKNKREEDSDKSTDEDEDEDTEYEDDNTVFW